MEQKQPRFFFDRRDLGKMEVAQEVLDNLTISGVSTAGLSAILNEGWAAFVLTLATIAFQLIKRGLAATVSRSRALNPINTSDESTITVPDPIDPKTNATDPAKVPLEAAE